MPSQMTANRVLNLAPQKPNYPVLGVTPYPMPFAQNLDTNQPLLAITLSYKW